MARSVFVFVALFSVLVHANVFVNEHVEFSLDGGTTWLHELQGATTAFPTNVKFRLRDAKSYVLLPACALTQGPGVIEWRGLNTLGVRDTALCGGVDKYAFKHLYADPIELIPAWHAFLHDSANGKDGGSSNNQASDGEDDEDEDGESRKKRRGFWSKYGFYIGAFICASLIQGIREGNAQYKQEMEETARAEAAKRADAPPKASVTVPRRKNKAKKSAAKKS